MNLHPTLARREPDPFSGAFQTLEENLAKPAPNLGHAAQKIAAKVLDLVDGIDPIGASSPHDVMADAPDNGTLYVTGGGDTHAVDFDDIRQGQLGDCYFLASLASVANHNPELIKNAIVENKNAGGEVESNTVTLYSRDWRRLQPQKITVDASQFSQNGALTGDQGGGKAELWVKVVEKAFAQASGGYSKIAEGGWPENATEALTGVDAKAVSTSRTSFAQLERDIDQGRPVTAWTPGDGKKDLGEANLVANHAYAVIDTKVEGGVQMVKLYNPWGGSHPGDLDPADDGGWITFDQYQRLMAGQSTGASLTDGTLELQRILEQRRFARFPW